MKRTTKIILDATLVVLAGLISAISIKYFVAPLTLNVSGLYGISIMITMLREASLSVPLNLDYFSVLYFTLNIPLIIFAYFKLGRRLVCNTLVFVFLVPFVIKVLPESNFMDIEGNKLTAVVIGSILFGISGAMAYMGNGSTGGFDVISIYLSRKYKQFSIAAANYIQVIFVFFTIQIAYNIKFGSDLINERLIYSIIFYAITGIAVNYMFPRHKIIKCTIIPRKNPKKLVKLIKDLFPHKSFSSYNVIGKSKVKRQRIDIVMSYYESKDLIRMLKQYDIDCFFFTSKVARAHKDFAALK